jgi:hypothetical protein
VTAEHLPHVGRSDDPTPPTLRRDALGTQARMSDRVPSSACREAPLTRGFLREWAEADAAACRPKGHCHRCRSRRLVPTGPTRSRSWETSGHARCRDDIASSASAKPPRASLAARNLRASTQAVSARPGCDHIGYLVGGRLHRQRGRHSDDHGAVRVVGGCSPGGGAVVLPCEAADLVIKA